jgi:hypothetical protein
MILQNKDSLEYLYRFQEGKIKLGLGLNTELDSFIRYKQGNFNVIVGLDNVGKTAWILYYFLCLTKHHKIKHVIWSGENKAGQLIRDLIQMYTGKKLNELTKEEIRFNNNQISKYFIFIDNSKVYDHKQLFELFKESGADNCLIDPFTGMNHDRRINQFERNYQFCNDVRQFCNETKKTVYINTHPQTESARRVYPAGHLLEGYIQPCKKSDVEGGQVFANRCDDFISIHRLLNHPDLWMMTEIRIEKIKDKETGGRCTNLSEPLRFDFNSGMGFTIGGINGLKTIN